MVKTPSTYDAAAVSWIPLQCHSRAVRDAVDIVQVSVKRDAVALQLQYQVRGDIKLLRIPELRQSTCADELWRHTCAEVFIASTASAHYYEFNFSPSTQWAAYQFSGYRQEIQRVQCETPFISSSGNDQQLTIRVKMLLPAHLATTSLTLGLSMVIEKNDGQCSYWALRHDSERPDFHRRENWIHTLK